MSIKQKPHNIETNKKNTEKNRKLSCHKYLTIEEKIQIFENFSQTGEELVGKTIFEGYPIGQWAIQIRSVLKRINDGKEEKSAMNISEEQLERLKKLGILERKIESTIDEKIDSLIEWRNKYPEATVVPSVSKDVLSEYAKTEKEFEQLLVEYEKMLKYYDYVRIRKSRGKLNDKEIEKCRKGNIGGVFGKIFKVNNVIDDESNILMKKYGLDETTIELIRNKYGSIDKFRKIYKDAMINQKVNKDIPKKILDSGKLIREFDLSSPDWALKNIGLAELIPDISEGDTFFAYYGGLEEELIELTKEKNFNEQEKNILFMLYGLNGEKKLNKSQIAKNNGISYEQFKNRKLKVRRRIYCSVLEGALGWNDRILFIDYDLKKKIIEEYFKNHDIFVSKEPISLDEDFKNKLTQMVLDGVEETKKRNYQVSIIKKMSEKQKLKILKEKFGERINVSDIRVVSPLNEVHRFFEKTNYIDVNKRVVGLGWSYSDVFYKECLDSEFCQRKVVEFMISDSDLLMSGKKENLEDIIESNKYFTEDEKIKFKEMLSERIQVVMKQHRIHIEAENLRSEILNAVTPIEQLNLTIRSCNALNMAGIHTVEALSKMKLEDLSKVRNLGKKSMDEVIKKMQYLGIEFASVDDYENEKSNNEVPNKMLELKERINSNEYISEEKKERLRELLYKTFNVTRTDIDEIRDDLEDTEDIE